LTVDQQPVKRTPLLSRRPAAALEPKSLVLLHGHHYSVYTVWKEKTTAAAGEWFVEHLKPEGALPTAR
jgi:hypothetical protein